jgi:membrane associated rhomboid family serine protease
MFFENAYRDNQPVGTIRGYPIYLTTILVLVLVVGLVFSALAGAMTAIGWFAFAPELLWHHGQAWRLVSYLVVDQVNFFTLFNLIFLFSFGRDCEKEMGRGRYLAFLALLILTPAVVATLFWLVGFGGMVMGSTPLSIGLVIAFATIYPNVPWFASIPMKFVAAGCLFLAAVGHLGERDQIGLVSTLATAAVSFGYIRGMREGVFSGFNWRPRFRRKPPVALNKEPEAPGDVDALLDKIAQSGFQSLTPKEKQRLEAAREELLRRNRR